ncbi:MAG: hypothetical protein Q8O09_03495 [Bacillota bacterium]|nr:hypothetical protein [Bacillota bacterium]
MSGNKCTGNIPAFLDRFSECQLVELATLIALILADGLDADDTSFLGDFIVSVGSQIIVIADKRGRVEKKTVG